MPAHDPGQHRQSIRRGAERGAWVYLPADVLKAAGVNPDEPAPAYRTWGRRGGSVLVRLYGSRGH